ncbi:MAG TPA: undecaprenyldiphospho-muramoylpentapeptide beta-N-acetylglucosaminyltransferase [Candidatus Acidoferrales bacterium]|nr:undecaprenyldiphospho-muramoylpentapeptide beta-N-acetylglucosaminyltransferase [Candidatus Acidoferrales bacterium]
MKLLIAGGGTGGHVFPALAIAREWVRRGEGREVVIVGTRRGLETRLVPAAGLKLELLRARGLKGIRGLRLVRNLALLPAGLLDAFRILRRHRFAAALGVGGYASGPMMLAAILRRVPSVLFEPNVLPGFTNRVLGRLARRVAVAQQEAMAQWPAKAVLTGCPVRPEFYQAPQRDLRPPFRILITGGSQGSRTINRLMVAAADRLVARKNDLALIHQTGEIDFADVRDSYARRGINAEVLPFIDDMPGRFAEADFLICRSGAVTVAELAAAGRAAIFIPFFAAADSHQLHNALAVERAGAGRVLAGNDDELTPTRLAGEILDLVDHPDRLAEMQHRARQRGQPRAAEAIVDLLEEVARP